MTIHPTRPTTPEPDRPGLTHTPPASYAPLDHSPTQHRTTTLPLTLALVLGIVHIILIKPVFDAILLDHSWVFWPAVTVIAVGAAALAWTVGARSAAITHPKPPIGARTRNAA